MKKIIFWGRVLIWVILFIIPVYRYFQNGNEHELAGAIVGLLLLLIFRLPILFILTGLILIYAVGNFLDEKHFIALHAIGMAFLVNIIYFILFGFSDFEDDNIKW